MPEILELETNIVAGTCTFSDLISSLNSFPISIPDYQRPFVWDQDKIDTLINDLSDHLKSGKTQHYYLGSLLFHNIGNKYEVIDGQQRLTSLLIIDFVVNGDNSIIKINAEKLEFFFNSPLSKNSIIDIKNYLHDFQSEWLNKNWNNVKASLAFSIIVTKRQDDAFSFFETQNNRGVKLSAVDYLKSFHLRELKQYKAKQEVFAKQWDKNNTDQFLNTLFTQFIWRNRAWKGKNVWYESQKEVLAEFQKNTHDPKATDIVRVFPTIKNKIALSLIYNEEAGITLETSPIALQTKSLDFPFAMRQPIEKGVGFFLYAEKYAALYHFLFNQVHPEQSELSVFRKFFKAIYIDSYMSAYLTELYKLCVITYYDKFESNELIRFAQHLDYFIGSNRIQLKSIVAQTAIRVLREEKQNLLDVISNAFTPDEVCEFLLICTKDSVYQNEDIALTLIEQNGNLKQINTVQTRYKRALLNYYNINGIGNLKTFKQCVTIR